MEEEVVRVASAIGDRENWGSSVAGEWGSFAAVGTVGRAFAGDGAVGWVVDWGDGARVCASWVGLHNSNRNCRGDDQVGEGQHCVRKKLRRWKSQICWCVVCCSDVK